MEVIFINQTINFEVEYCYQTQPFYRFIEVISYGADFGLDKFCYTKTKARRRFPIIIPMRFLRTLTF